MEKDLIEEPDQTRDPLDSRIPCPGCGEEEDCQCDPRLAVLKSLQAGDIVVMEDKNECRHISQVKEVSSHSVRFIFSILIGGGKVKSPYTVTMEIGLPFDYILTHTIRVLRDGEGVI